MKKYHIFYILLPIFFISITGWSFLKKKTVEMSGLTFRTKTITIDPNVLTYNFDPNAQYQNFRFIVNESSGCTVTMLETSAIDHKFIYITNLGPYDLIFQDQAGVSNFRDSTLTKSVQDNCSIMYDDSNIYLEWSAGNN